MERHTCGAKNYFDRVPKEWDALYSHESLIRYVLNRMFRKGLYQRFKLTFEYCGNLSGATVLDIGCGSGRYSIECARRGARRVVGIDFAPSMVEFSVRIAKEMGLSDICQFVCADFLSYPLDQHFDIVLALGFFDYIRDPEPLLRKIAKLRPQSFLASYPKFTPLWGLQRMIRYYCVKKCPIFHYRAKQIRALYDKVGFRNYKILKCGRGYFVAAKDGTQGVSDQDQSTEAI